MAKQKFQVGEHTYTIEKYKLDDLLPNEFILGPDPDKNMLATIRDYGIIYPIVLTNYEGKLVLIDGGRRIKAARILEIPEIVAQVFENVPPFDRAAWSLILNQQRSLNPIAEYHYLSQLREEDVPRFLQVVRADHAHITKVMTLDNIQPELRQDFIKQHEDGKIAEGTLFHIAKLSEPRQAYLKTVLDEKGKLTSKDVKQAKRASTQAVLAANEQAFESVDVEQPTEKHEYIFTLFSNEHGIEGAWFDFQEAHQAKLEKGNSWKVYRLVEV